MVSTVVDLCNMALGKIGSGRITSISPPDNSEEARWCSLYYTETRDEVLRAHAWKCATTQQKLAQLTDTPVYGFTYYYALPADYVIPVSWYPDSARELHGEYVASDEAELYLTYVKRLEDPTVFDDALCEAISTLLASKLATALANKPDIGRALYQLYRTQLIDAKDADGESGKDDDEPELWTDR